ncbi:MAG: hypothetical protein E6713_05510 [Sporomusaceae bacterium]|nr:hypothetical protein [Sporomusaceae bacterium]
MMVTTYLLKNDKIYWTIYPVWMMKKERKKSTMNVKDPENSDVIRLKGVFYCE